MLGLLPGYEGCFIQVGTQGIHLSHLLSVLGAWVMSYEAKPVGALQVQGMGLVSTVRPDGLIRRLY